MLLYLGIATVILSISQCQEINVTEPTVTCEDGWKMYEAGRTCIKVSIYCRKPWEEARADCVSQGADLVKITDTGMRDFVNENFPSRRRYWIGLHDEDGNGKFEWLDEDDQTSFESWICYAPRNLGGDERCVEALGQKDGLWRNRKCSTYRNFICQKDAEEIQPVRMCDFEDENNPIVRNAILNGFDGQNAADADGGPRLDASGSGTGHYIYIEHRREIEFQIRDLKLTNEGCLKLWAYYDIASFDIRLDFIVDSTCRGINDTTSDIKSKVDLHQLMQRSWKEIHLKIPYFSSDACDLLWRREVATFNWPVDFLAVDNISVWDMPCDKL